MPSHALFLLLSLFWPYVAQYNVFPHTHGIWPFDKYGPAWPHSTIYFYVLDIGQRWFPEWAPLPLFEIGHLVEVVSQQGIAAR
jgi:hypothetical protein